MPNTGNNNRGGSHEQHVKAGQQSHKNDDKNGNKGSSSSGSSSSGSGSTGGSREGQGGSKNS